MVKAGYQILEILKFSVAIGSGLNQVLTSFNGNKRANFGGEKSTMQPSGVSILENRRENLKLNVVLEIYLKLSNIFALLTRNFKRLSV